MRRKYVDRDPEPYHPKNDPIWTKPYLDKEEWRDEPVRHLYVHGGFEGTKTRFAFYYPPKDRYEGRFYQLVTPVQGNENASQGLEGDEDNIGFAVTHGAYLIESNMGGDDPDATMLYRASAASAAYSREVARRLYGEHRPYGYIFGGSGGGFKTMACVERTEGIWDGSVPFVIGSPMAIPNVFTSRVHAMRLLWSKFPQIVDAVEPGGNGDMYAGLNEEERAALTEVTRMGFPPRAWFSYKEIGPGALPILAYAVDRMDPAYYTDFWTKPGYLGADPNGSAARDRLQFETKAVSVLLPEEQYHTEGMDVDSAWQTLAVRYETKPAVVLESVPEDTQTLDGTKIIVTSGAAAGLRLPLEKLDGNTATVGAAFGMGDVAGSMKAIQPGDGIRLDNSDYIALQTYHRHQVPTRDYCAWDQFRDEAGEPIYPQRPVLVGPRVAHSGAGSVQSGKIHGKMIVCASLMDESAFPWQADWYRQKVREAGQEADFRLWYSDHAMHGSITEYSGTAACWIVSYRGALNQALLDVAAWAEKGIEPAASTAYEIVDSQVVVPESARERKGIQPVVTLGANGEEKAVVKAGETVVFEGYAESPAGGGRITRAEFDFEGSAAYPDQAEPELENAEGTAARVRMTRVFEKPGTYFPALRVMSSRNSGDLYTSVKNLARVRVVVE
jgi:hypothetical protein